MSKSRYYRVVFRGPNGDILHTILTQFPGNAIDWEAMEDNEEVIIRKVASK